MLNDNSNLKTNTTGLQELLAAVNNLPEAFALPSLTNEGSADDILSGKQLIDGEGNVVTGVFTIDNELTTQAALLSEQDAKLTELAEILKNKASASPVLQSKTVTPTAAAQIVTADSGYDGLAKVTVTGDENLISENIAEGISIFGIDGTHSGGVGLEFCIVHVKVWVNGGGSGAVASMLMYTTIEDGIPKSCCEYPENDWDNDAPTTVGAPEHWCFKDLICLVGTDIYFYDGNFQGPTFDDTSENITRNENAGDDWGTVTALTVNYNASDSFITVS